MKILTYTIAIIAGTTVYLAQLFWNGFVIMKLWQWLIVPTFNLTTLNIFESIGLALITLMLSRGKTQLLKDHQPSVWQGLKFNLTESAAGLGLGYILSFFL